MRFVLSTIGTLGDILPFVEIAAALRQRGHETVLLANGHFQPIAEKRGIDFHSLGSQKEYVRLSNDPRLYHPFEGLKLICDEWILPSVAETLDYLAAYRNSTQTVLVGSEATMGLRMAQELYGWPMHSLVLSPFMLPSVHLMPVSPGLTIPGWTPGPVKKILQALADHFVDEVFKERLNGLRKAQGMPRITSTIRSWWFSPDSVIGLFPAWFAPPQPDWPGALTLTGFVRPSESELAPEVREFVAGGAPLIVVTMGSLVDGNSEISRSVAQACLDGEFKALFLISGAPLPPSKRLLQVPFAPLSPVLRNASLVVHHAGIGTAAAALSAGIPQLVAPFGHDQFDNAARLVRLGVAQRIQSKGSGLLAQIRALLASQDVTASCERIRNLMNASPSLGEICSLLETGRLQKERKGMSLC